VILGKGGSVDFRMRGGFFGVAAIAITMTVSGCSKQGGGIAALFPNQRPAVNMTATRLGAPDTSHYAYAIHWTGTDADGTIERYQYAIDPPTAYGTDTLWVTTTAAGQDVYFRATEVGYDPVNGWRANGYHVFVLRALDDDGAASAVAWQVFYSYTIAPRVQVTVPAPSPLLEQQVPSNFHVTWAGEDLDGLFSKHPVQYKYRLFGPGDPEYDLSRAKQFPDSLRLFYAARNFAGWDSVGGDTTSVTLPGLQPNASYLFVVIGIDEAGAYSPQFSLDGNMLQFVVGYAGTMGPAFTVFNEFVYYSYLTGGTSTDPRNWIELELPADQPVTFHWFATTVPGVPIAWYRWRLDGDITDEAPRLDERTDWYHWSLPDTGATSCRVGPFPGGQEHFLYLEAADAWGNTSLGIVHFRAIRPTFESQLLVVDDTRLPPDRFGSNGVPLRYSGEWPAAAELDTFLYAKGGYPWRGPQGVSGVLPVTGPGVFAGYAYDTLGTRQGYELASAGVPLSLLGRYRHVLWMTDTRGATTQYGPTSVVDPVSTLKWMSDRGRASTLSAYVFSGGETWLLGGSAGYCTLIAQDRVGIGNNNDLYGPGKTIFSALAGELAPGRLMYDAAHWRSEMATQVALTTPTRSPAAVGGWTQPGWNYAGSNTAPDYSRLPVSLRRRALALGDSLPPTRTGQSNTFYANGAVSVEYLTLDNVIVEDVDPDPLLVNEQATLDTLMELRGGTLATQATGRTPVTMTYYHGVESPRFVFSGFDLWSWSRQDVVALVDFVLNEVWGLQRGAPAPPGATAAVRAPARSSPAAGTRTPGGRSARR
jgi:hypothetical protein